MALKRQQCPSSSYLKIVLLHFTLLFEAYFSVDLHRRADDTLNLSPPATRWINVESTRMLLRGYCMRGRPMDFLDSWVLWLGHTHAEGIWLPLQRGPAFKLSGGAPSGVRVGCQYQKDQQATPLQRRALHVSGSGSSIRSVPLAQPKMSHHLRVRESVE